MTKELSSYEVLSSLKAGEMTLRVRESSYASPGEYRVVEYHEYPDGTWDIEVERIGD